MKESYKMRERRRRSFIRENIQTNIHHHVWIGKDLKELFNYLGLEILLFYQQRKHHPYNWKSHQIRNFLYENLFMLEWTKKFNIKNIHEDIINTFMTKFLKIKKF